MELYGRVRFASHVKEMSKCGAARQFVIERKTVAKVLTRAVPPEYVPKALVETTKRASWLW
ncbi:hypothetical protein [uncultured Roseovarius sp.]|uniref:hypothetical protein n=1 Tax=uncultured Roseovarius sp. TaxID=293344 RepID=UPI0026225FAC|nr:hypothetical protein [uncultured Roseovarius sp.]